MATAYPRISRDIKLYKIGQAHLAPGMNLNRWREILARHGLQHLKSWRGISDGVIDAIIADVAAVVREGRGQ